MTKLDRINADRATRNALPVHEQCDDEQCPAPLSRHIGGKTCIVSKPSTARSLHDLPIFGRMWAEDGQDLRA